MSIDFGWVVRFRQTRGIGFASHAFRSSSKEVFFHIKQLKRFDASLAETLDGPTRSRDIFFWYEYRECPRGHEVVSILSPKQVLGKYPDEATTIIRLLRESWTCISNPLPTYMSKAAAGLLSKDEIQQLTANRHSKIEEHNRKTDEQRRIQLEKARELAEKRAARREAEMRKRQAIQDQIAEEEKEKEDEFRKLVDEMKPLGFSHSNQVSAYIVRHRLGHKYKNISGILEMERDGDRWNFGGGFPANVYAQLCDELGLQSNKSPAKPTKFTPYKDLL